MGQRVWFPLAKKKYCSVSAQKVRVEVPTAFTDANNVACTAELMFAWCSFWGVMVLVVFAIRRKVVAVSVVQRGIAVYSLF